MPWKARCKGRRRPHWRAPGTTRLHRDIKVILNHLRTSGIASRARLPMNCHGTGTRNAKDQRRDKVYLPWHCWNFPDQSPRFTRAGLTCLCWTVPRDHRRSSQRGAAEAGMTPTITPMAEQRMEANIGPPVFIPCIQPAPRVALAWTGPDAAG